MFGPTRWGGGWPLLYCHSCLSVETNVIGYLQFPYTGMDYRNDLDIALPPGEDWDQRGMCVIYLFNLGR
jgi:hypothetical protein